MVASYFNDISFAHQASRSLYPCRYRRDSEKKEHQGWGGDDGKRELDNENQGRLDAVAEGPNGEAAPAAEKPAGSEEAAAERAPREEEEEDKTKTLDEYLADLAAKRAAIGAPAKPTRTANDDEKQWKDFGKKVEKSGEDDSYFAGAQKVSFVCV